MTRKTLLFLICILCAGRTLGADLYISPQRHPFGDGSYSAPFTNIARGLRNAAPGDTVYLMGGRYATSEKIWNLESPSGEPRTIAAAPGEKVILDGTDPLPDKWKLVTRNSEAGKRIQDAQWKRLKGKIFSLKLKKPIYALIYKDRLMTDARWPNARWDDPWRLDRYMVLRKAGPGSKPGTIYDSLASPRTLEESEKWLHYDRSKLDQREESLAETDLDFTDSTVLLSCFWTSYATRITKHSAGENHFKFDTTFAGSGKLQDEAHRHVMERLEWDNPAKFKKSSHGGIHFFFMGLPALDIPEEWFYDKSSKTLYFISPDGQKPVADLVRGKRRDYALELHKCSNIKIEGLNFKGCALKLKNCSDSRVENCSFRFSAYNKFSVGNYDIPPTTEIINPSPKGNEKESYGISLVNCRFEYLDGPAIKANSAGLKADNILVYQTQITTLGGSMSRMVNIRYPSLIRRFTFSDSAASVAIGTGGTDAIYELNNLQRFGGLQYDGAALQTSAGNEQRAYRFNWSHDHPKFSYRFDTSKNGPTALHGQMGFNVAWNTPGGYMPKGDKHLIYNNLLIGEGNMYIFNMPKWFSSNEHTFVLNNAVPSILADRKGAGDTELLATLKNNFVGSVEPLLRDPENLDFRPKQDSPLIDKGRTVTKKYAPWATLPIAKPKEVVGAAPDIGAYESGAKHYWIPGFKYEHASTPIPPDGSTSAKADCSLMWLGGYKAQKHHIYIGASRSAVAEADKDQAVCRGTFAGDQNVYTFERDLPSGTTVYWRVDAERDGKIFPGEVWTFTVE